MRMKAEDWRVIRGRGAIISSIAVAETENRNPAVKTYTALTV